MNILKKNNKRTSITDLPSRKDVWARVSRLEEPSHDKSGKVQITLEVITISVALAVAIVSPTKTKSDSIFETSSLEGPTRLIGNNNHSPRNQPTPIPFQAHNLLYIGTIVAYPTGLCHG